MTGVRIDWHAGTWRLWDIRTGAKLDECQHLVARSVVEFVNDDNGTRGFAVTCGEFSKHGNRIVIEGTSNGKGQVQGNEAPAHCLDVAG